MFLANDKRNYFYIEESTLEYTETSYFDYDLYKRKNMKPFISVLDSEYYMNLMIEDFMYFCYAEDKEHKNYTFLILAFGYYYNIVVSTEDHNIMINNKSILCKKMPLFNYLIKKSEQEYVLCVSQYIIFNKDGIATVLDEKSSNEIIHGIPSTEVKFKRKLLLKAMELTQ